MAGKIKPRKQSRRRKKSLGRVRRSSDLNTLALLQDNQSRKSTEKIQQKQAQLLDLANDTIMIRSLQDIILFWNQGAERLYGWTKKEAVGKYVHSFLKTVFPVPLKQIQEFLLKHGHWEGVLVHQTRDGRKIIVASRWSLDRDEQGKPSGYLEINNDITEQKRSERELQRAHNEMELRIRERTAQLSEANARLRALSKRLITAHEEERLRISRELHDDLGQILTSISLDIQRAGRLNRTARLKTLLDRLLSASQEARNRVRELSSLLRPRVLDDVGLKEAIQTSLAEFAQRSGVETQVRIECHNEQISDSALSSNIYRILQEALTNISEHAKARKVSVVLKVERQRLTLKIQDNGIGFDLGRVKMDRSFGLLGMKERATLLGGKFKLQSTPRKGTKIEASFPL